MPHSLWLVPEGPAGERLAEILRRLGAQYHGPPFRPHITLVGSFPGDRAALMERSKQAAAALKPLTVRLGRLGFADAYFRDLFVHAGPRSTLHNAHKLACDILGLKSGPDFTPHLSLLYGNHTAKLKQQIMAGLRGRLEVQFKVRRLCLYDTSGDVGNWHEVGSFKIE